MMKSSIFVVVMIAMLMAASVTLALAKKGDDKKYCNVKGEWEDGDVR